MNPTQDNAMIKLLHPVAAASLKKKTAGNGGSPSSKEPRRFVASTFVTKRNGEKSEIHVAGPHRFSPSLHLADLRGLPAPN